MACKLAPLHCSSHKAFTCAAPTHPTAPKQKSLEADANRQCGNCFLHTGQLSLAFAWPLPPKQKSLEADAKRQRGKLQLGPELLDEYNRIKQASGAGMPTRLDANGGRVWVADL